MACDIYCCSACGKDTRNKSLLCSQCLWRGPSYVTRNGEQKGRSMRYMKAIDDREPDEETSDTRYHGDNYDT